MCLKWERFGESVPINPTEDFTRLAFETVTLCTMGEILSSIEVSFDPNSG